MTCYALVTGEGLNETIIDVVEDKKEAERLCSIYNFCLTPGHWRYTRIKEYHSKNNIGITVMFSNFEVAYAEPGNRFNLKPNDVKYSYEEFKICVYILTDNITDAVMKATKLYLKDRKDDGIV